MRILDDRRGKRIQVFLVPRSSGLVGPALASGIGARYIEIPANPTPEDLLP
jgi:hypothetical protein